MLNIFPRETVHYKKFRQLYVEGRMAIRFLSKLVNAYQSRIKSSETCKIKVSWVEEENKKKLSKSLD